MRSTFEIDHEALSRALKLTGRKPGPADWREEAERAVYHCQIESLKLRPWQSPPCVAVENDPRDAPAVALCRQLLEAGLSLFEPDPVRALEAAAARQRGDNRAESGAAEPS